MRKTHWACLLLGLMVGVGAGALLVVLQLKYGGGPLLSSDTVNALAETESCVEEPKPLDDEATDSADDILTPAASKADEDRTILLPPVPVGPVQVTVVHRTSGENEVRSTEPAADATGVPSLEQVQQRMLNHLLRHAQTVAQTAPTATDEIKEEPAGTEGTEAAAEMIPAPHSEPAPTELCRPTPAPMPVPVPTTPQTPWTMLAPPPMYMPAPVPPPAFPPALSMMPPPHRQKVRTAAPCVGTYACTLDSSGELTLPAEVHEMMDSPRPRILYLEPEQDNQYLFVWTAPDLKRSVEEYDPGYGGSPEQERERQVWYSRVRRVEVAADGRLKLPAELVKSVGLKEGLRLIGVRDHFEIWDAERWAKYSKGPDTAAASRPMQELLNDSDWSIEDEWERVWFREQPCQMNPQRVRGGIQ